MKEQLFDELIDQLSDKIADRLLERLSPMGESDVTTSRGERYLTTKEVMARLNLSKPTIHKLINQKDKTL